MAGPVTHCEPSGGPLASTAIAVPNANAFGILDPGVGNRRGIVVSLHGGIGDTPSVFPQPTPSDAFSLSLQSDGWIVAAASLPEDFWTPLPAGNGVIYNDVANDSGHGSRYLATWLHAWDHYMRFLAMTYGAGRPMVVFGGSDGGWKALQVMTNRMSSVVGYMVTIPACYWDIVNPAFTPPTTFSNISWAGMDLTPTWLNAVTVPGIINYNITDNAVGYWSDTVASGSNGVDVATFSGSGTLNVTTAGTSFVVGPRVMVTGLTGGTGGALINFSGTTSTTLTGCMTLTGSGTLNTNNPVIQNYTLPIYVNAQAAGQPISQFASTGGGHSFTASTQAAFLTWIQGTLDPNYPVSF